MIKYLRDQIKEEIQGAKDYYSKAVECKSKHPDWAYMFYKMGDMEIEHANCLTKMFNSIDKTDDMKDSEYAEIQKSVIAEYVTSMSEIENLKKMFFAA